MREDRDGTDNETKEKAGDEAESTSVPWQAIYPVPVESVLAVQLKTPITSAVA